MVQKIGISVSDELFNEIQEVKGSFKISQVCQDALKEAVAQATMGKSKDIEQLKTRLRAEKRKFYADYIADGYKDGVEDAFSFSYADVEDCLEEFRVTNNKSNCDAFMNHGSEMSNEKYDKFSEGFLPYPVDTCFSDEDITDMYVEGWCNGVMSVLEQIKDSY